MKTQNLAQLWAKLGIPADYAKRAEQRLHAEAQRLVFIDRARDDGRILKLAPRAAAAWRRMQAAATIDGVTLLPLSAFRSVARQTTIIRRKLAAGQLIEAILRVSAVPGCSEHHTGRALDLGTCRSARRKLAGAPEGNGGADFCVARAQSPLTSVSGQPVRMQALAEPRQLRLVDVVAARSPTAEHAQRRPCANVYQPNQETP